MKTLYFDVDGTILLSDRDEIKPCLAGGMLEWAARRAGFAKLVCVGNFARIAHTVKEAGIAYDELGILLSICRGAFLDNRWFRAVTSLVADPESRAECIDFSEDWYYMDDLAVDYFRAANLEGLLAVHLGARVMIPDPRGSGQELVDWLNRMSK